MNDQDQNIPTMTRYIPFLYYSILTVFTITFISCTNDPSQESNEEPKLKIVSAYSGSMDHMEYDSVYNDLILYENGTFSLTQVDRIAEHHLNEKTTNGIYEYLSNKKQIGLFLEDGSLILRFVIENDNQLRTTMLDGSKIVNENRIWREKSTTH